MEDDPAAELEAYVQDHRSIKRDQIIQDLIDELKYREQIYILSSIYYNRRNLMLVIPILITGTSKSWFTVSPDQPQITCRLLCSRFLYCISNKLNYSCTVSAFGAFLGASPIIEDEYKPVFSVIIGGIATFSTLLTGIASILSYAARAEAFRAAGASFRILHWRLHFDDAKDEMGGHAMDVLGWESFQQDMLDVVKNLKFFPPPHKVVHWTLQGKLGKRGMKDSEDMFMPAEYEDHKKLLHEHLGVFKMEDLMHVTPEEIHACGFPPAIENKLIHERHTQMKMRGLKVAESKKQAGTFLATISGQFPFALLLQMHATLHRGCNIALDQARTTVACLVSNIFWARDRKSLFYQAFVIASNQSEFWNPISFWQNYKRKNSWSDDYLGRSDDYPKLIWYLISVH